MLMYSDIQNITKVIKYSVGKSIRGARPHGGNLKQIIIDITVRSIAPTHLKRPLLEDTAGKTNARAWIYIFICSIVNDKVNMMRTGIGERINTNHGTDAFIIIGIGMKKTEGSAREKGGIDMPLVRKEGVSNVPMGYCLPPKVKSTMGIIDSSWKTKRGDVNSPPQVNR